MLRCLIASAIIGVGIFIGPTAVSAAPPDDLVKAAEAGNATAQFRLGVLYLRGSPETPKDVALAISWARKAADQGLALAQNLLGSMFYEGIGMSTDPNEAKRWWLKAADQGLAAAQFNLGRAYEHGVPQDFKEAVNWYEKAAAQGDRNAQGNLGTLYITGRGVAKDARKGEGFWRQAANQGLGNAQFNLGLFYESGAGGRKDLAEAENWFVKAAAAGVPKAAQHLAGIQKLRAEGRTEKKESDYLPPLGPKQTYKGKTLIGSTYSDANNEAFFTTVKLGLDMMEKLPNSLREGVHLIQEVIYDPPSPQREKSGTITNVPVVYTIGPDLMKPAPAIVYQDMKYSKSLDFVEAFAGAGRMAKQHHQMMDVKRKIDTLKANGEQGTEQYASLRKQMDSYSRLVSKTDLAAAQAENCDGMKIKFEVYKVFESDPRRRDAVAKRLSELKCW